MRFPWVWPLMYVQYGTAHSLMLAILALTLLKSELHNILLNMRYEQLTTVGVCVELELEVPSRCLAPSLQQLINK
jgi:hypothetical protein